MSKIIAPNGRELKISYLGEDIAQEYHDKPALLIEDGRYNELIEKGYNKYYSYSATPTKSLSIDCMPVNYNWLYVNGLIEDDGIRQTLNKMALISRVTTDDTEIIFSYEDRKKVNISNDAVSQFAVSCGARLKSVIKRCAVVTERTTFEHTYENSSYMLLKSVTNSMDGKHTFEYNRIFNTPCTQNVDYWGYSRNNMTTAIGVIPDVPESVKNDNMSGTSTKYEYDSANRLISESYKTVGAETELLREYKYNLIGDNAD